MESTKEKPQSSRAKPLSADEIRRITTQAQTGFPGWATSTYGKTHVLRWISQSKIYNEEDLVDSRGYEILKDPKTGKNARWNEMLLGAMPIEIADERKKQIAEDRAAQEDYVKANIESAQDRMRFELERAGYSTPKTKFNYTKNK